MAELSEKKKGIEELLEKIPPEKRWALTAHTLWRFIILSGDKTIAPQLGVGKDIISPLWSKEKWYEITLKIFAEGGRQMMPMVKEMFNIPVEDAIGAAKLGIVTATLLFGPEYLNACEIVEATRERAVRRQYKCPNWEWYDECEVDPEFRPCDEAEQAFCDEGYKAINPKITYMVTKARQRGDPYCEAVFEFKEE